MRVQDYQELFTNFPFSSQVLTGVFLEFDYTDPSGNTTSYTHTILDRIGFAARNGQASATISIPAGGQPAFTSFDSVTMDIESSLIDNSVPAVAAAREDSLMAQLNQGLNQIGDTPAAQVDPGLTNSMNSLSTQRSVSSTQTRMATLFDSLSQNCTASLASFAVVKAYPDRPIIRVFGFGLTPSRAMAAPIPSALMRIW